MARDREQEEDVLRITARYVEEVRAGHQPRLSDYLARYPQYSDEIADFVTYYHAVEAGLPEESVGASLPGILPNLSADFRIAMDSAWNRIEPSVGTSPTNPITTLLITADKQRLSLPQLATKLGLSEDIVTKLEQHGIAASTIPREVVRRMAAVLQQPLNAIQAYFGLANQPQVAEAPALYHVEEHPEQTQSFREALEQSEQLSSEQKAVWYEILGQEKL